MRDYYVEISNGETFWVEARTDSSAYKKACKEAKRWCATVTYMCESYEEEDDRPLW